MLCKTKRNVIICFNSVKLYKDVHCKSVNGLLTNVCIPFVYTTNFFEFGLEIGCITVGELY